MLTPGTILIQKDALRPPCFQFEDPSSPNAWMTVKRPITAQERETELAATGWTFFYMANQIRTTAFGFDRPRMIDAALKRIITSVRQERCNCLEIGDVAMHSFLGMPYVSLSAHPRHIQKGMVFGR